MPEIKTKKNKGSVSKFIQAVPDVKRRKDAQVLVKMFAEVTGKKPTMWGTAIVGYGMFHYKSARSTQEGDWPLSAFSPRKQNLTLYIMHGLKPADLKNLGPHTTSKGCLYIKRLSDVNLVVLKAAILKSYKFMQKQYPRG
ncbi:MAG: DUF1801 domain-containing protein [Patescibacteria group bacterium]|jgi:hypothetical protein